MASIPRMALTKHEQRLLTHWVTGEPLVRDPKPKRVSSSKPEIKKQPFSKFFRWPI